MEEEPRDPLKFAKIQDATLGFRGEKKRAFSTLYLIKFFKSPLQKEVRGYLWPHTPLTRPPCCIQAE